MGPAVVELEIPREWRFSRISYPGRGPVEWDKTYPKPNKLCYYPKMQELKDPMDEDKYKESAAFPLLKPNIEVFGLPPPATLRRQRGWHQRTRWPPTAGKVVRWTGAATGADVPQELFDNVLSRLTLEHPKSDDKVETSKRELGQISLVCRHWAKLFRPVIFERLELRNRGDAVTLLSFLRCPTSIISGYISKLDLKLSVASYPYTPWIHTVCFLILHRLPAKPDIELTVGGPLPSNKAMTGIYDMVPPTYPHCSSGIQHLTLYNVRFKLFADIMSTIGDMPDLQLVDLQKVTWDRSTDEEFRPPPARRTRFQQPKRYHMRECADDAAIIWLRLLLICSGSDRLDEIDADQLYRTLPVLLQRHGGRGVWCEHDRDLGPDTFTIEVGTFSLRMSVFLTSHVEGQPRHVRAIAFRSRRWETFIDINWKEVATLLSCLSTLETLLFVLQHVEDVKDVNLHIICKFRGSSQLKCILEVGPHDKYVWVQVACADDGTIKKTGPRYKGGRYGWMYII